MDAQAILQLKCSEAEIIWIKDTQQYLTSHSTFNQLDRFKLFMDENGIWRCGGRLANADIPYYTKHPVMLPRDHPFAALVVQDAHARVGLNGAKDTLTEVRSNSGYQRVAA